MNTNITKAITTAVAAGVLVGFGATKVTGNALTGIAVTVGYLTVGALVAIIATDYRPGNRGYTA